VASKRSSPAIDTEQQPGANQKWLHENRSMRKVSHMNRRYFSEESKKKLWRPCREAQALGL
jgi:hypothetical protein